MAILVGALFLCYAEVLLFDLENRLRHFGRIFAIGFPIVVFIVAFLIATSPRIVTHPASWDPMAPRAYEAEEYMKRKSETETRVDTRAEHVDSIGNVIQKALDRAKEGPRFELIPMRAETMAEKAVRLDAERGIPVESMAERIAPAYKEALLDWEKKRRFIPAEHSLELKEPIDRRVAPYWLALLLLVGTIEFRLLSTHKPGAE